ncbi:MAG: hypothetical protein J0H08_08760 [Rhizobiales bacterium]|nr:hypothetical protein [Hyphomicrobiales bacterium]
MASMEIPEGAEISDVAAGYWAAWHALSADRPMGSMGGAGRIPRRSIRDYADDWDFADVDQLARMLWAMDDVYLKWLADEQKAASERDAAGK